MTTAAPAPEVHRDAVAAPVDLDRRQLSRRLLVIGALVAVVAATITLVPGLAGLRSRFTHANPDWLLLGGLLKVLSGLSYVAAFRAVFCRRMRWRLSGEIGLAELGANAVVPTGGAGGLALGAWALRRGGMDAERIARRSVAFFLLTSLPNVVGVILLGLGLALGLLSAGHLSLALTLGPAVVAVLAIALTLMGGRWAGRAQPGLAARRGEQSRLSRAFTAIAGGVGESLMLLRRRDPWLWIGLAGYLAFDVMILWATFHAFGPAPAWAMIGLAYLIGELGGLIPLPGGIGGVDLGLVGTLVLYHAPVGAATAAVLAYRAVALWIPAVLGAGAFALLRRSLAHERATVADCAAGEEVEVIGRGRVRLAGPGR